MVIGMSPWETVHVSWAKAPASVTSFPKVKGMICGGSKKKKYCFSFLEEKKKTHCLLFCDQSITINP